MSLRSKIPAKTRAQGKIAANSVILPRSEVRSCSKVLLPSRLMDLEGGRTPNPMSASTLTVPESSRQDARRHSDDSNSFTDLVVGRSTSGIQRPEPFDCLPVRSIQFSCSTCLFKRPIILTTRRPGKYIYIYRWSPLRQQQA